MVIILMKLFSPLRATSAAPRRQMRRSLFILSPADEIRPAEVKKSEK